MPPSRGAGGGPRIRRLTSADRNAVTRIDAHHSGARKAAYWTRVFREFVEPRARRGPRVALGAEIDGRLAGYLFGEVRAFEFGSEPCGWVFAVGVEPGLLRRGVASALLDRALAEFRAAGVDRARTMVRRSDIPVLSFFRARGFVGGPYAQLEHGTSSSS